MKYALDQLYPDTSHLKFYPRTENESVANPGKGTCKLAGQTAYAIEDSTSANSERYLLYNECKFMPAGGVAYIVHEKKYKKVIGYIDAYGRVFDVDSYVTAPPCKLPILVLDPNFKMHPSEENPQGYADLMGDEGWYWKEERIPGQSSYDVLLKDADDSYTNVGQMGFIGKSRVFTQDLLVPLDDEVNTLKTYSYAEFMALCFIRYYHEATNVLKLAHAAGPQASIDSLHGSGLFEALDEIVEQVRKDRQQDLGLTSAAEQWFAQRLELNHFYHASIEQFVDMDTFNQYKKDNPDQDCTLPDIFVKRVNNNMNFLLDFDPQFLSKKGYERLLALEALMNSYLLISCILLGKCKLYKATKEECNDLHENLLWKLDEERRYYGGEPASSLYDKIYTCNWSTKYEQARTQTAFKDEFSNCSHSQAKSVFALYNEELMTPQQYRWEFYGRINTQTKLAAIEFGLPSARTFELTRFGIELSAASSENTKICEAPYRDYVSSRLFKLADMAFKANPDLSDVYINGYNMAESHFNPDSSAYVVSVQCPRAIWEDHYIDICNLKYSRPRSAFLDELLEKGMATYQSYTGACEAFVGIKPRFSLEDTRFFPASACIDPRVDTRKLSDKLTETLNLNQVNDLNIFEQAQRGVISERLADQLALMGTEAAIDFLKHEQDKSEDPATIRACNRAIDLLSEDPNQEGIFIKLDNIFEDPYQLNNTLDKALSLHTEDEEGCIALLEDLIKHVDDLGIYKDGSLVEYRYFSSYASRILYARDFASFKTTRLIPDALYEAYRNLAWCLCDSISATDKAIAYAKKAIELAPTSPNAYLALSRCYFKTGDLLAQTKVIKQALPYITNQSDFALCFYWIAYSLWKGGNPAAGLAAYQFACRYDSDIREMAFQELNELMAEHPNLHPYDIQEGLEVLKDAGIDLECLDFTHLYLLECACGFANMGAWRLAGVTLLESIGSFHRDLVGGSAFAFLNRS